MVAKAQATEASTQAPEQDTTPVYEVAFHVVPTVGDGGVGAVVEKVRRVLGDAEIISESLPVKMALAYTVERATEGKREKYAEAYFGWIKFAAPAEAAAALGESMRGIREVVRSLVIRTTREEVKAPVVRAVYGSDRLEGKTIAKAPREAERGGEVSEEELQKSIEALTQE